MGKLKQINILLLTLFFLSSFAQASEPVAMITDLTGKVKSLDAHNSGQAIEILSYLDAGSDLLLAANSTLAITLFSPPAEYLIKGPARLVISAQELALVEGKGLVRKNLSASAGKAAQKFSAIQRERLTLAAYVMRSTQAEIQLLEPVETELLGTRPVFSWTAPAEQTEFVVTIFDENTSKIVYEPTMQGTFFELPKQVNLQRGHRYSWRVSSEISPGLILDSTSTFSLIDRARAQHITKFKPAPGAPFSTRLNYALFLESEGLKVDARKEWKILSAERPDAVLLQEKLYKTGVSK